MSCGPGKSKLYTEEERLVRRRASVRAYDRIHAEERRIAARARQMTYYAAHTAEIAPKRTEYQRKRRQNDPSFRIKCNLSTRLWKAAKHDGAIKVSTTIALIGCSPAKLRFYLETLFKPGMSWENYGEWHIDHIRPCASFDLMDPEQQAICFHYTNLQPLWATDNHKKGAARVYS